jgi:predicted alpha/beta superfamily hydrolase
MNNLKWFFGLLSFLLTANAASSQITKVETPGPSGIKFKSVIDSKEYILYIHCPDDFKKTNKKYPVLYVLDAQWSFSLVKDIYYGQYFDGMVPDIIIIGITWPGDYDASRARDFSPTHTDAYPTSGNASGFLSVIKNEIVPYIDSTYPADKNNRALCGGSFGGLFALYSLFHEPALFNRYIIMGPSLRYDDELTFKFERSFAAKNRELNAKIFFSAGQYEEEIDFSNAFTRFINQLKANRYKGLEMESLIVEKMGHAGEGPYAISRGLHFIYSKPEILVDNDLLDRYTGLYVLNNDSLQVTRLGSSLFINNAGQRLKLYAETADSFYAKGLNGTGQFLKDNKGKVTGYNLVLKYITLFFKRIDNGGTPRAVIKN